MAGLGSAAALTGRLILFRLPNSVRQNDIDRLDIADVTFAEGLIVETTISPIELTPEGANGFNIGPYEFPTVLQGSGQQAIHTLRWYVLAINEGNILLDAGAVTAGGVQFFGVRPDATPDQTINVVIG